MFYRRPDSKRLIWLSAAVIAAFLTKQQSVLLLFWLVLCSFGVSVSRKQSIKDGGEINCFGRVIRELTIYSSKFTGNLYPATGRSFDQDDCQKWRDLDVSASLSKYPSVIEYLSVAVREGYAQILPWYWGVYRWLSLTLPFWVYRTIKLIMIVSLVSWVIGFRKIKNVVNGKVSFWLIISSLIYLFGIYA